MLVNKPPSMSVQEWLTKSLSMRDNIPLATINRIMQHQTSSTREALLSDSKTVELSGLGKFYFNVKKAEERLLTHQSNTKVFEEASKALVDQILNGKTVNVDGYEISKSLYEELNNIDFLSINDVVIDKNELVNNNLKLSRYLKLIKNV